MDDMLDTMYAANGIGLAAIQIGVPKRIIVMDLSKDPNIKENNYVTEVWYPELNKNMKVHGTPWKFSKTPANIRRAPKLGEHNDQILSDLGYTKGEIESLKDDKVI